MWYILRFTVCSGGLEHLQTLRQIPHQGHSSNIYACLLLSPLLALCVPVTNGQVYFANLQKRQRMDDCLVGRLKWLTCRCTSGFHAAYQLMMRPPALCWHTRAQTLCRPVCSTAAGCLLCDEASLICGQAWVNDIVRDIWAKLDCTAC